MKIALAQPNPIVGDITGNVEKILGDIERARRSQADLVVFPELVVGGYPPKDLLLKPSFVRAMRSFVAAAVAGAAGFVVRVSR